MKLHVQKSLLVSFRNRFNFISNLIIILIIILTLFSAGKLHGLRTDSPRSVLSVRL
jgi:hypothetical protein